MGCAAGLLVLVLVGVAVWFVVQQQDGWQAFPSLGPAEDQAMRVLRERYARGEIDRDEFEERRRALER